MNNSLVKTDLNPQLVAKYDFNEKPAQTPGGGKSSAELVRKANTWRDNYNPLRGLVIARVVYLLEQAERGDYAELELTVRKIEKRYPVFKGLKTRRLAALEELDWDIKIKNPLPPGADEQMAEKQQAYLRARYDLVANLTEVFGFLTLAEFRGFSILQKHRFQDGPNDGAVSELHWLPQWTWSRAGQFGDWFYNQNSQFGIAGDGCQAALGEKNRIGSELLPRTDFVIREVEDPLYEIALIAFVNWSMARKDYSAFVEIFGLPNGVIIMPANIPAGQEDKYQSSAESVANGVSGALPNGSDVKFPTSSFRNNGPFKEFCGEQDADVVLAGTGGRLAMLGNDKGGLGDGPAQEHADAFDQIARADARKINQILQSDFDRVELTEAFPAQPLCVYFELSASDEEDAKDFVTNVNTLKLAGKNVTTEFIAEKTGYEFGADDAPMTVGDEKKTEEEDDNIQTSPRVQNRAGDPAPETAGVAETLSTILFPLMDRIDKITKAIDAGVGQETIQHMVDKLLADFPHIADVLKSDDSLAKRLTPQIADALLQGLKGQPITNRGDFIRNGDTPGHEFHGNQYTEQVGEIREVMSGKKYESAYAPVTADSAARIKAATGQDVTGYKHVVDREALTHIFRTHGVGFEKQANQVPLTKEDIEKIPHVVNNPDKIEKGTLTGRGLPAIKYSKRFNGTTVYVEEVWSGQKTLAAKTMYKIKNRAPGNSATSEEGVSHTSETSGAQST